MSMLCPTRLDRLDVVSFLWQHNISANLMYESGLPEGDHENHLEICAREGILYVFHFLECSSARLT
jgi:eukaryotic translation initiation factor 2-alpha kinase 4